MPDSTPSSTTTTTDTNNAFEAAIAAVAQQAETQAPTPVEPPAPPAPVGPPKLTLQVSEGLSSGRSGYLSFNDVDGQGWANLYPEAYRPSPLGTFSLSTPNNDGFSAWSYTPGKSLDNGEVGTDVYLVKDRQGATYQVDVVVTGKDDLSTIDGTTTGAIVEGVNSRQSGTLVVHDPDANDAAANPAGTHLLAYDGPQGRYGTFSFNGSNTSNSADWVYNLDNNNSALLKQLLTGQKVVETFQVKTSDGQAETVEITLHGEDDPALFGGASALGDTTGIDAVGDSLKAGNSFNISADAAADAVDQALSLSDDNVAQAIADAHAIAIQHEGSLDALLGSDAPSLLNLTSRNGGSISIEADAQASATGALGSQAEANAEAIGFQNVNLFTDGNGEIRLGVDANAEAYSDAELVSQLQADARAYGLQGTGDDDHTITVVGNPFAEVAAKSLLVGNDNDETLVGGLNAEAVGIQHAEITSIGDSNLIGGNVSASIGAQRLGNNVSSDPYTITIGASAIGVDDVLVRSNGQTNTNVIGKSSLTVDLSGWEGFQSDAIDELTSVGIRNSDITTSSGNDRIQGSASSAINQFELLMDDASLGAGSSMVDGDMVSGGGIVDSHISTGAGNDTVIGTAQGDGFRAAQGFVDSSVNTGLGNDVVVGGAHGSSFLMGLGNDAITLEASEGSLLSGGIGNDNLKITGASSTSSLDGGIGNDVIQGGSGADVLHGGVGSDVIKGGAGADSFVFKGADMLSGTDRLVDFNGADGDSLSISGSLTGLQKGVAVQFVTAADMAKGGANLEQAVIVDTMANIQAMGTVSHSHLAYATDTGALMFDANGDWSQGSRTVAVLNNNGQGANLGAEDIKIS
jgi:VCBS repeat-containing protein